MRRTPTLVVAGAALMVAGSLTAAAGASPGKHGDVGPALIGDYKHLVVIYEENHSFDNLYGDVGFGRRAAGRRALLRPAGAHDPGSAERRRLRLPAAGRREPHVAQPAADHVRRLRARRPGQRTSPTTRSPSTTTSARTTRPARRLASSPPTASEGHRALPGGCTRDLVHRFYQEQYQLNGGLQNRYVTGSDAVGLTMGHYNTTQLPIYQFLHGEHAPELRDRRPLLPGRVRRIVPEPPVPGGRALHRSTHPAEPTVRRTPWSTATVSRTPATRSITRPRRSKDGAADPGLRAERRTRTSPAATTPSTRFSRPMRRTARPA